MLESSDLDCNQLLHLRCLRGLYLERSTWDMVTRAKKVAPRMIDAVDVPREPDKSLVKEILDLVILKNRFKDLVEANGT